VKSSGRDRIKGNVEIHRVACSLKETSSRNHDSEESPSEIRGEKKKEEKTSAEISE